MKKLLLHSFLSLVCLAMLGTIVPAQDSTVVQVWNFEESLGNWTSGAGDASIELSDEQAIGDSSVKLVGADNHLEINLQNDVYEDIQEGDIIQYNIWISSSDLADVDGFQIFWHAPEWTWNSSDFINASSITGDQWNTIEFTFPAISLPVNRIGLQLLLQTGNETSTPTLYADSISITRISEDEEPLPEAIIESFDDHSTINSWGNGGSTATLATSDDFVEGTGSLDMTYEVIAGESWGGSYDLQLTPSESYFADLTGYEGLTLFMKNLEVAGFTVQVFVESTDGTEEWDYTVEAALEDTSGDWQEHSLPFSSFAIPSWLTTYDGELYQDKITEIRLQVLISSGAATTTGRFLLDNLTAYGYEEPSAGDSILNTNGSFENTPLGTITDTEIEGWVLSIGSSVDPLPEFVIVDDTVQHGNHALKVVVNATGSSAWHIEVTADSIHVTPGEKYKYSVWAKSEISGARTDITVGNYAHSEYGQIRPANLTDEWKEFTFTFTITDEETYIRGPIHFSFSGNVGNSIYIDNLQITAVVDTIPIYEGPPLAEGKSKFLGCAYSNSQAPNFESYWNQVTPENAGKWGSVEATRDEMDWDALDAAYKLAKDNGFPFRFHVLIWGNQQPSWIEALSDSSEEQLEEIREWFQAVADRYPDLDYVEVVNEPINDPPIGEGNGNYIEALGGTGETGYDWILNAFRMAREIFPSSTKLMINEYNIVDSAPKTTQYLNIIRLLQEENLIDGIGAQGHAFNTVTSVEVMKTNIDSLATTGLPVQITELDIDGSTDAVQLIDYQRIFPTFWEHPAVEGITLWGWRPGLWRDAQGANLIEDNNQEKPALEWLREYVQETVVATEDLDAELPMVYSLNQNYPNPFNPTTTIEFALPQNSDVKLVVYDILGRAVANLIDDNLAAGYHRINFNASNLATGVYFYRIKAGDFVSVKKLLLLK
jgi:endo-1,4-beta-xylanase